MRKRTLQNYFEYFLFRSVSAYLNAQPLHKAVALHRRLAWLWHDVLKIRREVALENVLRAFPELSRGEAEEIVRRSFAHYSRVAVEQILLPKILFRHLDELVFGGDWTVLDRALQRGKGAILVGGHLGNWELMGSAIARRGYPLWAVAAVQRNPLVDHLINAHRKASGLRIIPKNEARKKIPEVLSSGEMLGLVSDQDAGERGVFVPFFGIPASTPAGPAVYALRYGAALIYIASYLENGRYRLFFEELPVKILPDQPEENIRRLTALHVRRLEKDVRRYPEQYFWVHRRWKTRPKGL